MADSPEEKDKIGPGAPKPIDPASFLLPKKEGGPSADSAQRINAGALFEQEKRASQEAPLQRDIPRSSAEPLASSTAKPTKIGDVSKPAVPPPPKKEETVVKALETYGSDINRVVQSGDVSMSSIAAAEAERRARGTQGEPQAPQAPDEEKSRLRPVLIAAGAVLIVAALALVAAIALRPGPVPVAGTPQAPLISVDQTVGVPVVAGEGRDALMTDLEGARAAATLSLGLVERLYVAPATTTPGATPDPLPPSDLLGLFSADVPQQLLLTLEPTYLLGIHSFDQNQALLILRVDSYQQAYSGMLGWEQTMRGDLAPLFTRTPEAHIQNADASSTAATTTDPNQVIKTGFVDQVVDNHDARVVKNATGDILLLWTFLDRNTLVITTNEYTLGEIISRLNTASLVPQPQ